MTDEDLMMAVSRGDLHAFGQLVLRHQATAWNAAYRFFGQRATAEDIAQEAFLRILDAAPRYRPSAGFKTYLLHVVTHLCLDHARRKQPVYQPTQPDAPADLPSPADRLIADEREQAVRAALRGLPDAQRMAAILRYYEGLSCRQIAAAMETTEKAVERLLARARAALAKALDRFVEP